MIVIAGYIFFLVVGFGLGWTLGSSKVACFLEKHIDWLELRLKQSEAYNDQIESELGLVREQLSILESPKLHILRAQETVNKLQELDKETKE